MRVPQVSERIKEAPAQALRGVFAGIGQLLLYTDKLRNKAPYARMHAAPPAATRPAAAAPAAAPPATASPAAAPPPAASPAAAPPATAPAAAASPAAAPRTEPADPAPDRGAATAAATEIRDFDKTGNVRLITADEARANDPAAPAAAAEAVPAAAAGAAESGPPLPNYDQLSIASLRARLRNLDVTQVRGMVEYEKGHAGRPDVLTMLERRIAKLEAGD
jgi:hypothetical protein